MLAFAHVAKTPYFIHTLALVPLGTTTKALATPLAKQTISVGKTLMYMTFG
jgi:hypothetical protein